MSRSTDRRPAWRVAAGALAATLVLAGAVASAQPAAADTRPWASLGRAVTAAELTAWDIDVRPDFRGLPAGSGSVAKGQDVWEAKCASCHGIFGEATEVFGAIVGGTTRDDVRTGRVANLTRADFPQRTTLMKLSQLSTLWDYINRAMPWNEPKSLTIEEVYAVTAYILHLGDVLPADFTLSDRNVRDVQAMLPNRNGMRFWDGMWTVRGKADVSNAACMKDCPTDARVRSSLPEHARAAHGNLAEQNRLIGGIRGADTTQPVSPEAQRLAALAATASARPGSASAASDATASGAVAVAASADGKPAADLARDAACLACHGIGNKIVGPSLREVGERYKDDAKALENLVAKVRNGGQGTWGPIPMPPQPQVKEEDAVAIVKWILDGAR
jgi:S-disulfanyl-L-cysteine oxidoreductase SoxD